MQVDLEQEGYHRRWLQVIVITFCAPHSRLAVPEHCVLHHALHLLTYGARTMGYGPVSTMAEVHCITMSSSSLTDAWQHCAPASPGIGFSVDGARVILLVSTWCDCDLRCPGQGREIVLNLN